ncbi:hypothetical protein LA080_009973 [Diaporthe eres]|nr:hypothetical protein LA080_009973 [Diaporthe eres]
MIICFSISSSRGGAIETTKLFSGKCSHTDNINRALQAVLALLAMGISLSFDFFMRLVSSPTVDDLREAHSQGQSLDIAIHSFRNVRHISHWRTFAWVTLILLAVPIQLFSHSIAFVSFNTTGHTKLLVREAFTTGQNFTYPGVAVIRSLPTKRERSQFHEVLPILESASAEWDKLEVSDCSRIDSEDIEGLQSHRNILVVIEAGSDADTKEGIAAQIQNDTAPHAHDDDDSEFKDSLWSFAVYKNGDYTKCKLSYDNSHDLYPYATESRGTAPPSTRWTPVSKWEKVRPRWGQAISKSMWLGTYVPIAALLLGGSAALAALRQSITQELNRTFAVRDPITGLVFAPSNDTLKLAVYCLIVNAPQLSISICYFSFSSLYSALFQAKFWADFSTNAQLLRVSFPRGEQQEGTPALQFPWVWGLSFILLKAAIGWSLTQSFYLVPKGDFESHNVHMLIGFSMRAMILTVSVTAVAVFIPVLLSVRRLPPASVVVGTDSAAIAAYCPTNTIDVRHQGSAEGQQVAITAWDDLWRSRRHLQPLRWGVLNLGSATLGRPGVLGLGTEDEVLGQPIEGQEYVSVAGHFKLYVPSALEAAEATV